LFAFDGEVFDISNDFSVLLNSDGIYGVGNGSKFAIGALYAGVSVEKALEIAANNDIYTSGPYQIVRQQKQSKPIKKA
jgi:ATP-dependent protease HslVU (ClpYQ) peptidase subunit